MKIASSASLTAGRLRLLLHSEAGGQMGSKKGILEKKKSGEGKKKRIKTKGLKRRGKEEGKKKREGWLKGGNGGWRDWMVVVDGEMKERRKKKRENQKQKRNFGGGEEEGKKKKF